MPDSLFVFAHSLNQDKVSQVAFNKELLDGRDLLWMNPLLSLVAQRRPSLCATRHGEVFAVAVE